MKKKIICLITCFMLLIGSLFALIPLGTAKADTIRYEGFVSSDSSVIPDYAVTSIEELNYNVRVQFDYIYDSTNAPGNLELGWWKSSGTGLNHFNKLVISNRFNSSTLFPNTYNEGLSMFVVESLDYSYYIESWKQNNSLGTFFIKKNTGSFKFSFTFLFNYTYTEDLNSFVDMKSDNSIYNLFPSSNSFVSSLYNNINYPSSFYFKTSDYSDITFTPNSNSSFYELELFLSNIISSSTKSFSCVSYEVNFEIYRPTERVNNSLVFYNYNYTYLNCVSDVEYTLRKKNDYYVVSYYNDIPNDYYVVINCVEIQNKIFDEYISLNMSGVFSENSTSYLLSNFVDEDGYIKMPFGFDFNFTYYTEPLVASNGSYNFDFKKPSYVKMEFSLSPFYIPVLEAVENIFIFLIFYCPVISDILSLLKLDLFIGGLISILNYLLGLEIGQFITSCIAFVIFFAILKSFMPVVFRSSPVYSSYVQYQYDIDYDRREKAKENNLRHRFKREDKADNRKYRKNRANYYTTTKPKYKEGKSPFNKK